MGERECGVKAPCHVGTVESEDLKKKKQKRARRRSVKGRG